MSFRNDSSTYIRASLMLGASIAALVGSPALAQTAPEAAPETAAPEASAPVAAAPDQEPTVTEDFESAEGTIVVTGSRIRRPNLESVVPVISVSGGEFFETGQTSVGDVLNELPALRSTFSTANSTRFLGTSGLNLLDLRGLGTQRTLVLVNGRRHVASNILGNAVEVDTNTIPTDLIERVDVVTGGNSAIYGSDAIAGVVNFILKDDYEGVQLRGQGGVSKYGDAGNYYVSVLAGTNFADNRGNVAVNLEYARQEDFYASQRGKCFSTQCGYVRVDTDPASAPSDGTPDRVFFENIRSALYTNGGAMYFCCQALDPADPLIGGSGYFTVPYKFQSDGSLVPITGQRVGVSYFGSFIGGNGNNFRDGKQFGLSPKLDRYAINLIGHYEVSPALVPFVEAKWVRTESFGNASGPFFAPAIGEIWQDGPLAGFDREALFTDNPYLSDQARTLLEDNGLSYFYMFRNYVDLGNREEKARRDTFRIVGGVRGDFNEDWSYEVSLNYGKLKEKTRILGNVNLQRYLLAVDTVDEGVFNGGPANGNIVCRSKLDPTAAQPLLNNLDPAFAAGQLAGDVAACVPLNPFGSGNISQAAKNYVLQDSLAKGWIKEFVINGFMSGDTSQFLNLPGGPIGFAIGGEHRSNDVSYKQDEFTSAGMTFYNAIPDFTPPTFKVNEVFGELRLPILKGQLIDELTVSGAARYAKYKTFGGVWAWNIGGELAPIPDIRFRVNWSRAVRAPSLADAYTPLGQNFSPGFADPCDNDQIGSGSATRAANCLAAGVPVGFNYNYTASLGFLSGGNSDLKPETSNSFTVGGVAQPRFLPGFAVSVDYYNIRVYDVITSPSAQDAINACYDLPDLNNQFCSLFERAGPGGGPRGEIPGRILENSLQLVPLNYAKLQVRGIDVDASYRHQIGNVGLLNTQVIYTHVFQNDQFLDPTDPNFADQLNLELGDPKDAFNWNTSLKTGRFTFGYQMRYLGKMLLNGAAYEFFFSKQGRDPEDPDWAEDRFYSPQFYHDIRAQIDIKPGFNFYLGIDDLTNNLPPKGQTGIGGGSGIYRNIGRFMYAGVVAKF
ncbi:TonB-dependent receptor [Sphingomonas sp. G124]|uniref:TonB-dependent receptor n=1 Tax=Sphingomonas cremea TaxID=2904799 RepID=A0A9X1QL20_9SPHN|nr:TonB-dependent receptor [Sphingomonas cremea]MCF2514107.1 TonB-dependent receptor [Sphingomonas cremea]